MAEFSSLPLFTDAWLADTSHLSRAERGLYMDLLVLIWRSPECRVPNDLDWVGRRLRCSPEEQTMLQTIVSEFCSSTGNWLTQKRLRKEFEYVRETKRKQSDRAKSRWNKEKDISHGNATPHASGNAPSPSPSPSPSASSLPPSEFERVDAALRAIPGVQDHPVYAAPGIDPIWKLIQQGVDFKTQIVPSIKSQLAKRPKGRLVKGWSYFVPGILDSVNGAALTPPAIPDEKWQSRLDTARRKRQWDERNWGPMPGQPHCRVPQHLLRADDGHGWTIWQPEVAA